MREIIDLIERHVYDPGLEDWFTDYSADSIEPISEASADNDNEANDNDRHGVSPAAIQSLQSLMSDKRNLGAMLEAEDCVTFHGRLGTIVDVSESEVLISYRDGGKAWVNRNHRALKIAPAADWY